MLMRTQATQSKACGINGIQHAGKVCARFVPAVLPGMEGATNPSFGQRQEGGGVALVARRHTYEDLPLQIRPHAA